MIAHHNDRTAEKDTSERPAEFVLVVSIHVKPGHEREYLDLCTPVLDAMRYEPTFVNTVLHQDPEDPTRFMVWETWVDREDFFDVQMKRDYRRAYETRLPEILIEPRTMKVWQPLRGDFAFFGPGTGRTAASMSAPGR